MGDVLSQSEIDNLLNALSSGELDVYVLLFSERSSASGNRETVLYDPGRHFLRFSLGGSDDNNLVYKMASQKENRTRKHGGDFA